jgi:hypothetical protein
MNCEHEDCMNKGNHAYRNRWLCDTHWRALIREMERVQR